MSKYTKYIILFLVVAIIPAFAITDWDRCVRNGVAQETKMMLKTGADSGTSTSIASAAITANASFMIIDTEDDSASDTLSTINAAVANGRYDAVVDGDMLMLRQEVASQDITIDATGNLDLGSNTSITLSSLSDRALFQYDTGLSKWVLITYDSSSLEATIATANVTAMLKLTPVTATPDAEATGNIFIRESDGAFFYYNGSAWTDLSD